MHLLLRHKLLIVGVTAVAAASAGGAYAATQSGGNSQQAFINDVAKRLNVSPAQLRSAVKAALIDRLNAAVKDGRITQAQAQKLEQRINQGGRLPFFFFGGPGRAFGAGPGRLRVAVRANGGALHAAASYLGLSNAQLMTELASGKSLAQVANAHGKSVSGLEQVLITAETARLNKLQSKGTITKAQEQKILARLSTRIDKLVNRTGFGPGSMGKMPRMMGPGGPMPQGGPMPKGSQMQQGGPMAPPAAAFPSAGGPPPAGA